MGNKCEGQRGFIEGDWDVSATKEDSDEKARHYEVFIQEVEDYEDHFEGDETGVLRDLHIDWNENTISATVGFDSEDGQTYEMTGQINRAKRTITATVARDDGTWTWVWRSAASGEKAKTTRGNSKKKNFQWKSAHGWNDYDSQENKCLLKAYLSGHKQAKLALRGQDYEYDFKAMKQSNTDSGRTRQIRPPMNLKVPAKPIVPAGPTTVMKVPPGAPGNTIEIPHPDDKSQSIAVSVPRSARVGAVMMVPIPPLSKKGSKKKGKKEKKKKKPKKKSLCGGDDDDEDDSDEEDKENGPSALAVAGAGVAAVGVVGGMAVAGAIVGQAVQDGDFDGLGGDIADAAGDAGDFMVDAGGDLADMAGDAAGDAGDFIQDGGLEDFGEDAADFLLDAGEDAGDFIMDLF